MGAIPDEAVLAALYLIFNEGYLATSAGTLVRRELCDEAIKLTRVLAILMPREPEVHGLLGLMLMHHSRRDARVNEHGDMVLLEDQDRSLGIASRSRRASPCRTRRERRRRMRSRRR